MKNIFSAFLNAGLTPDLSDNEYRRVRATNIVALFNSLVALAFIIIFAVIWAQNVLIIALIAFAGFKGAILANKMEAYGLAKSLVFHFTNWGILIADLILPQQLHIGLLYYILICQPWILHDHRTERRKIITYSTIVAMSFLTVALFHDAIDLTHLQPIILTQTTTVVINGLIYLANFIFINIVLSVIINGYFEYAESLQDALANSQLLVLEKEEAQANVELANQDLTRSLSELEQLAYASSHDLKMPLRGIISFSQLIKKRHAADLKPDAVEYLDYIIREGKRQFEQIDGLLAYLKAGKAHEKTITRVDAYAIISRVVTALKGVIESKQVIIKMDLLPYVYMAEFEFEQIIFNILSNAIKFTHPDRQPVVEISGVIKDDQVEYRIADNGLGFEMEYHDQLFGIFKTLSHEHRETGSGIGLSVCKKIVNNYGGEIWAESEPNKGATFYFTLPRKQTKVSPHDSSSAPTPEEYAYPQSRR